MGVGGGGGQRGGREGGGTRGKREEGRGKREEGRGKREREREREEGRGKREEGRGKREEGRGKREEGRGKREEGRGKREEGRGKREEGRGKREEGRGKREEGRGKREEGRGKREEGRGKREERKREEGRGKREEARSVGRRRRRGRGESERGRRNLWMGEGVGRSAGDSHIANMDTLAEWLRRRPAKPMGSPRVGSNPTGVVCRARQLTPAQLMDGAARKSYTGPRAPHANTHAQASRSQRSKECATQHECIQNWVRKWIDRRQHRACVASHNLQHVTTWAHHKLSGVRVSRSRAGCCLWA